MTYFMLVSSFLRLEVRGLYIFHVTSISINFMTYSILIFSPLKLEIEELCIFYVGFRVDLIILI